MLYLKLGEAQREDLMDSLAATPRFLHESFDGLSQAVSGLPGPGGTFSPVEQVWHLADLEQEGFGRRIRRLQAESHPSLPDFDGARMAQERNYLSLSLSAGLAAFDASRRANLACLKSLTEEAWSRSGTQEGVGPVALCDIPVFMQQHDQAHIAEIRAWQEQAGRLHS
jgi:DinB superfamily